MQSRLHSETLSQELKQQEKMSWEVIHPCHHLEITFIPEEVLSGEMAKTNSEFTNLPLAACRKWNVKKQILKQGNYYSGLESYDTASLGHGDKMRP